MKRGFTLVELSIVLVIIGLLIGGILAAQSMIATAKTDRAIKELQQYSIAIVQFKNKYNQDPGDSDLFDPKGDNNGNTVNTTGVDERISLWEQLYNTGGIKDKFTWDQTKMFNSDFAGLAPTHKTRTQANSPLYYLYWNSGYLTWWPISSSPDIAAAETRAFQTKYDPEIAIPMDSKMDDGAPLTGHMRTFDQTTGPCSLDLPVGFANAAGTFDGVCMVMIFFHGEADQPL